MFVSVAPLQGEAAETARGPAEPLPEDGQCAGTARPSPDCASSPPLASLLVESLRLATPELTAQVSSFSTDICLLSFRLVKRNVIHWRLLFA